MKVLIQLRSTGAAHAAAVSFSPAPAVTAGISNIAGGLTIDPVYPPVQLPGIKTTSGAAMRSLGQPLTFSTAPLESTYIVRGQIPDGSAQPAALAAATSHPDVVGVYSDPLIESCITCAGTPPIGTASKVATLLSLTKLKNKSMDGQGVYVAIVDTGINTAHLKSKGRTPKLDAAKSFTPSGVTTTAGQHPLDHGTMCAYDAGILAPKATLLDYAVLLSRTPGATAMTGLLSDAVLAYSKLRTILSAMPAGKRSMVVNNSWGMYSPTWDFPPGHPGNYSDNPNHPFNIIVSSLEAAGADILFAAGNCGRDCMDGRCNFATSPPICGANSSPAVLCVAGVDANKARVGYSSQGPGRLTAKKPDFASYTHFSGSEAFGPGSADAGTSAACPVAAGAIAAIRTKYPSTKLSPLQLRSLISKTADDTAGTGFDLDHGWGLLNVGALLTALP